MLLATLLLLAYFRLLSICCVARVCHILLTITVYKICFLFDVTLWTLLGNETIRDIHIVFPEQSPQQMLSSWVVVGRRYSAPSWGVYLEQQHCYSYSYSYSCM